MAPVTAWFFFYAFNDGSSKPSQDGQKIAIEVSSSSALPPESSASPPALQPPSSMSPSSSGGGIGSSPSSMSPSPSSSGGGGIGSSPSSMSPSPSSSGGGIISSSPAYPSGPEEPSTSPFGALSPGLGGGDGAATPFISSNPAVPLPGDVDSATMRPLASSSPQRPQPCHRRTCAMHVPHSFGGFGKDSKKTGAQNVCKQHVGMGLTCTGGAVAVESKVSFNGW